MINKYWKAGYNVGKQEQEKEIDKIKKRCLCWKIEAYLTSSILDAIIFMALTFLIQININFGANLGIIVCLAIIEGGITSNLIINFIELIKLKKVKDEQKSRS